MKVIYKYIDVGIYIYIYLGCFYLVILLIDIIKLCIFWFSLMEILKRLRNYYLIL